MTVTSPKLRPTSALCALVAVVALAITGFAGAKMHSTSVAPGLCETTGGGRFVDIPGFPGEMIDRRLLTDIHRLEKRYRIFVTDGYSMSHEHVSNGEHPIGLALDIVPNKAVGGTWSQIDRLAAWAEPRPDKPRQPFRWVGYDGDAGHGRGHHLHLSWSHSVVRPGHTARTVYTMRCPSPAIPPVPPIPPEPPPPVGGTEVGEPVKGNGGGGGGHGGGHAGGGGGGHGHGGGHHGSTASGSGGLSHGGSGSTGSGGIGHKRALAPPVVETDGVDAAD